MNLESFNLVDFLNSLDLTVGAFRIKRVEETSEPNMVVALSSLITVDSMSEEMIAQVQSEDMLMPCWVLWIPEQRILRFSTNLDLGPDSLDGERIEVLVNSVNYLNFAGIPRVAKAFVHQDKKEQNIGTAAWTISLPPDGFSTPESLQVLRDIASENMARLLREAALISIELHSAMQSALAEGPVEADEGEAAFAANAAPARRN